MVESNCVRLEAELRGVSGGDIRAHLQALVDRQAVKTLAGGEQGGSKRETVDFAFDSEPAACSPDFRDIERNGDGDPAKV